MNVLFINPIDLHKTVLVNKLNVKLDYDEMDESNNRLELGCLQEIGINSLIVRCLLCVAQEFNSPQVPCYATETIYIRNYTRYTLIVIYCGDSE